MVKKNQSKVSIIIPVYNVEEYLGDCLDSVINQSLQDIEIICVNDASTDRSLDLLQYYQKRDKRISVINYSSNGGQSRARNQGLKYASGEYVYFLDSDDLITPEAMQELYIEAKDNELDVVCFDAAVFFENERLEKEFRAYSGILNQDYPGVFTGPDLFTLWVRQGDWVASICRKFWRREYLTSRNLYFYENIIHEDELFSFMAVIGAERISCLKRKYFKRRLREASTMTKAITKKNFVGLFVCCYEIFAFWEYSDFKETVSQAIADHIIVLIKSLKQKYQNIKGSLQIHDIYEIIEDNSRTKRFLQLFIADNHQRSLLNSIDDMKLAELKKYEKVIIFGAGAYAKEVIAHLGRHEILLYGFAVSDTSVNPSSLLGHTVYDIKNLTDYRQEAAIVVAASPKYCHEIYVKLAGLGFCNIVLLS